MIIEIILLLLMSNQAYTWHATIQYNFKYATINNEDNVKIFESSYAHRDYFSLLSSNKNNYFDWSTASTASIKIGARNNLYELSVPELKLTQTHQWHSSNIDIMKCLNRSIIVNKDECDNYIKFYTQIDENNFKLCSTNALNPKCRYYHTKINSKTTMINETSGIGYTPLRAYENKYIYNYVKSQNNEKYLFTANSIDLNRYFSSINRVFDQDTISTNVDDNNWLNKPEFVSSFANDERIFIVFNEESTIEENSYNSNSLSKRSQRHSKIAQICLNDNGAPLNSLRNIWTTYLKSKLSCVYDTSKYNNLNDFVDPLFKFDSTSSLFYFDEIKSMSELYKSPNEKDSYFYALFTTSANSITGSAVCAFSMDQIMGSYDGDYKLKPNSDTTIPNPRPSQCPKKLTYQHIIFSRKAIQMNQDIVSEALIVETNRPNSFISIDVDFNVKSILDSSVNSDVVFVGTDDGKVLTFVLKKDASNNSKNNLVYSEELTLINNNSKNNEIISNIKFHSKKNTSYFIAITKNKVITAKSHYCHLKTDNQKECNNLINPYCIWSNIYSKCMSISDYLENNHHNNYNLSNQSLFFSNHSSSINKNDTTLLETNMTKIITDRSSQTNKQTSVLFDYKIINDNSDITISINLILFILMSIAISFVSIFFTVIVSYKFYRKFSTTKKFEHNNNNNNNNINNKLNLRKFKDLIIKLFSSRQNDTIKKLDLNATNNNNINNTKDRPSPSFIITSSIISSSTKSYSPTQFEEESTNTKSSSLSNYKTSILFDDDPRYVYVNNALLNSMSVSNSNSNGNKISGKTEYHQQNLHNDIPIFLDYDESEYYSTLKRSNKIEPLAEQKSLDINKQQQTITNTGILDTLPGSSKTLSSLAVLMRNHFDLPEKKTNDLMTDSSQLYQLSQPIYSTVTRNIVQKNNSKNSNVSSFSNHTNANNSCKSISESNSKYYL